MFFACIQILSRVLNSTSHHVSLIYSKLWQFPSLSFFFTVLRLLKNTAQLFYFIKGILIGLCHMSFHNSIEARIPGKNATEVNFLNSSFCRCMTLMDHILLMLKVTCWLSNVPYSSYVKLLCIFLVTNICFVENTLKLCKYTLILRVLSVNFSIQSWICLL